MPDRHIPPRWEPGRLPDEQGAEQVIARRFTSDLAAMTALHDTVMEIAAAGHWEVPRRGTSPAVVWTVGLTLNKCLKTFRAIHILAERGFVVQCHVLIRQLAEQAIVVAFILQKNSKLRTQIYHAYGAAQMLKMIRHWQRTPGLKRRASVKAISLAEQALRVHADHLPSNVDYKSHWSGKGTLENVARELKLEALYASLFRFTSRYSHGSDFVEHIVSDDATGEGFVFTLTPDIAGIDGVSIASREMLWLAATSIDRRFKLGFTDALEKHRVRKPAAK